MDKKKDIAQEVREDDKAQDSQKIQVPFSPDNVIKTGTPEWREAVEKARGVEEIKQRYIKNINEIKELALASGGYLLPTEYFQALLQGANESFKELEEKLVEISISFQDTLDIVNTIIDDSSKSILANNKRDEEKYKFWVSSTKEKGLYPNLIYLAESMEFYYANRFSFPSLVDGMGDYLEKELEKPQYKGLSMLDLYRQKIPDNPDVSLWDAALITAGKALKEKDPERYKAMVDAELLEYTEEPARVFARPPEKVDYPLDKVNAKVWRDLGEALKESGGQLAFAMERRGSKQEATLIYSINFDDLEKLEGLKITKTLTNYDKRVYIAAGAIYNQSGECMSAGQIYAAMGGRGKPNPDQLRRIDESLTKMGAARIYIDNTNEITVNKNYPKFVYDAPLLPFERISAYINGTFTDNAIHLFREPPLLTFAKGRKQVTTVTRRLLEMPLSHTEENLQLEDYLIERIAAMKKPGSRLSRKILFSSIYEACGVTGKTDREKKSRQRLPTKVYTILDHLKKHDMIKGYTKLEDGTQITLCPPDHGGKNPR